MSHRSRIFFILIISITLSSAWAVSSAQANEVITLFNSDIHIHTDATIHVVETITVNVEGNAIQRGIYRDFPTRYTDSSGRNIVVPFHVASVTLDGNPEAYTVQDISNGKRIRIGQKNVMLSHKLHTYTIEYTTGRQIGFFANHDELYWNVTGNGWGFPIEEASATLTLPPAANIQDIAGYTGRQGSRETHFQGKKTSANTAEFVTTAPLAREEGLTIVASWQKGVVQPPTSMEEAQWLFWDNADLYILAAGTILVFLYYFIIWWRVGRDPRVGTIVPLFAPPKGISPAAARFVMRMGFDEKCFSAAIIDAAVKGSLTIQQQGKRDYTLIQKKDSDPTLSHGERAVMRALFSDSKKEIELKQEHYAIIGKAKSNLKKSLTKEYESAFFVSNVASFVVGAIISVLVIGLAVLLGDIDRLMPTLILSFFILVFGIVVINMVRHFFSFALIKKIFLIALIPVMLLAAAVPVLFIITEMTPGILLLEPAALASIALLNLLFFHLLKAPTVMGRLFMDQIEGFKMFLDIGEKERLATLNPPQVTPELFEQFLPYALALGVEQAWGEKFNLAMTEAGQDPATYVPVWYAGSYWHHGTDVGGFASSLGSTLTSTVASSSTAPGSSSGFGGGGSSGGGGGGGGGGGW